MVYGPICGAWVVVTADTITFSVIHETHASEPALRITAGFYPTVIGEKP